MTTAQVLAELRRARPNIRYAANKNDNAIAAWIEGRWIAIVSQLISGGWSSVPQEILVNGEPLYKQDDWVEQ
jgi:hypothetical protein